jgi:hypothetical protein
MDHSKIILLKLVVKKKGLMFGKFPNTLTSLIAHGHGDETFVQYSNEFSPNDLNFTIGSLLQLL